MATKKQKQNAFLEVYARNLGVIKDACETIGISRQAFYKWLHSDKEFKKRFDETDPYALTEEVLKQKLMEHVDNGNLTALIFTLKAKFGWTEGDGTNIKAKTLKVTIGSADG